MINACRVTIMYNEFMENHLRRYKGSDNTSVQVKIPVVINELPETVAL